MVTSTEQGTNKQLLVTDYFKALHSGEDGDFLVPIEEDIELIIFLSFSWYQIINI